MMPFEPRRLSLLLCLLLACVPTPDPSSNPEGQVRDPVEPRGMIASRAAPLAGATWDSTRDMLRARSSHTATLLSDGKVLVAGGEVGSTSLDSAEVYDPTTGTWAFTGSLARARHNHTATLLPSGKVLVVGGDDGDSVLASAEVYDPATGAWSPAPALKQARSGHTASMSDGKLLVVGGSTGASELASVEVYDPKSGTWSSASSLAQARARHTASALPGGKVLVVGGAQGTEALASAEVYDPKSGVWTSTDSLGQARAHHTATPIRDGKLLVAGGQQAAGGGPLASAEVYDPATGLWSSARSPTEARTHHSAALLPDGRLLVVGGFNAGPYGNELHSTEVYDPKTDVWSVVGSLSSTSFDLTATLLTDGTVLVAGGTTWFSRDGLITINQAWAYTPPPTGTWSSAGSVSDIKEHTTTLLPDGTVLLAGGRATAGPGMFNSVKVYEPSTRTWSSTGKLTQDRYSHTATLLPDGRVLVVGGANRITLFASAEVYDPASGTWSSARSLKEPRSGHTATVLPDGQVLVVGGRNSQAAPHTSAEVYDPASGTWSSTGSLKEPRAGHTATLLPDGRVLVLGGQADLLSPNSAEVYDRSTGKWSSAPSMMKARRRFTATPLPDGRVLVVGGDTEDGMPGSGTTLADTELYDPNTGSIPTGSLSTGRSRHTATPLPGGKVLVVGGSNGGALDSAEVYDPATGRWALTGSLAETRQEHSALLLPGGNVLVVSGAGTTVMGSAELYVHSEEDAPLGPSISGVSPPLLEPSFSITVTGERFRGSSETGGGNTQSSSTTPPLLSLSSVDTGRWVPLLGHDFSDTSVSAPLPYVPHGYYLLNVTAQGRTSSRLVSIINRTPPDTSLDSASPAPATQSTSATFSFSSEPGASFECSLDGATFSPCTSPQHYASLQDGEHLFRVRARDPEGKEDPSPAQYRWTVDSKTPPETVMDTASAPLAFTPLTSAHFSFSASEEGSSFECSLDGGAFMSCSNPKDYTDLAEGEHTFQVRAIDMAGNVDPTAAEYRWTVDSVPPPRPELQVPTDHQQFFTSRPVLSGTAEPGCTVRVFVDGVQVGEAQANAGSYWELVSSQLDWSTHKATATATDAAGNTSQPSLEVSFATVQHGYYGMGCAAAPSALSCWPWILVTLGLLRRRRSH